MKAALSFAQSLDKIAEQIAGLTRSVAISVMLEQGKVKTVHANPTSGSQPWPSVTITLPTKTGSTERNLPHLRYFSTYAPVVNDNVFLLHYGPSRWLVLGKLA